MSFTSWLRNLRFALAPGTDERRRRRQRSLRATTHRPQLEVLEDRCQPSTFTVLNLLDSGPDSLRAAITAANANPGADAIDFATSGTVVLTSGQLDVTDSVTVNGPGAGQLTISGNDASHVFEIRGSTTNVLIRDLSIVHGYTQGFGGGIYNAAVLTVSNCTLSYNSANGTAGYGGGAIANVFGTLTVSNSALSYNSANGSYGGAINNYYGTLTVTNSTISSNAAVGGSYRYEPGDEDPYTYGTDAIGGGLYVAGGTVSIEHSTIADNYASGGYGDPGYEGTGYGGGIYNYTAGALHVYDTIIANNSADYLYGGSDLDGYVASLGRNLIGDSRRGIGFAASDLLDINPLLGPLQDNGGPTQTMALLPGSPAVNTGDNAGAPAYDQRGPGFPRVFGGAIDIGAFEAQSPSPTAVSISNVSLSEGNVGATAAVFTVQLSAASTDTVSVHYTTADGSATVSESDYQAASGTLTFAPGQTSKTITVLVNGDRLAEPTETFVVNLSSPTNATIADGQGVGTIADDEPRISITPAVSRSEGNTGQSPLAFAVTLSSAYDAPVTVDWATADGSATAGSDYQSVSGTLTFAPGETSKTIAVPVLGDTRAEPDESFFVNLSSPVNAVIADGQGVATIRDDDPPELRISDTSLLEGRRGTTAFVFTVSLSSPSSQTVTVRFATRDGTATVADEDYRGASGTLTFAPGQTSRTITVLVQGDRLREGDETFAVDLFDAVFASIADGQGIGTIRNDD